MDPAGVAVVVAALLGAGGVGALVQSRAINRRTNAQARESDATAEVTLGGGWQRLVGEQRTELNELRERLAVVEARDEECQRRLALLESGQASPASVERLVISLIDQEIAKREL